MMDRNTLTALLLITLVLILTPYYMDLVSPAQPIDFELIEETDDTEVIVKNYIDTIKSGGALREFGLENHLSKKEKTITIE